jgi:pyruvate/2-oxoglutarate/acetoin dehydrogenase E1 component
MADVSIAQALNRTLRDEMRRDPSIFLYGEDVEYGGRAGVSKGLRAAFGPQRVIDTPINEELFVSIGIGAAQVGLRPIVEFCHGAFATMDLHNFRRLGIWRFFCADKISVPVVVRLRWGTEGLGHELSSTPISALVGNLGLTIVAPTTPRLAKGLLTNALRTDKPTVLIEDDSLYALRGPLPEGDLVIPFGNAELRKRGTDISFIAYGRGVIKAEAAANMLGEVAIDAEVLDLVSLEPLDTDAILESASKTGRVVILAEEPGESGFPASLKSLILSNTTALVSIAAPKAVPLPFGAIGKHVSLSIRDVVAVAQQLVHPLRQHEHGIV